MTIWPEWIASGEPFVVWGVALTVSGGVILLGIVVVKMKDTMLATPKRAIVGAIGMALAITGMFTAIVGVLGMHGVPMDY